MKNIQTNEAKINLVTKFLDYAICANASYAPLETIKETDKLNLGAVFIDESNNKFRSTYARTVAIRFLEKDNISQISKIIPDTFQQELNNETIQYNTGIGLGIEQFVNRFRLLNHQENTSSRFSATLFEDTQDSNQKIFVIRGTEPSNWKKDIADADIDLMLDRLPSNQYIDMIKFYVRCIADKYITESTPLIIAGHSLGGALAQLLTLSLATAESANNVKEVYTFNSPGAKNLKIDEDNLGKIYTIDSTILNARDKERVLFKKIRGYEYGERSNFLRDTTLIGYDNHLFNEIYKYFLNNENLKEHSILVRTLTKRSIKPIAYGAVTYTYKIFNIDETFINCLKALKTNNLSKQPLACKSSVYHIESDDDSNPDNNEWQDELIQNLGKDIDGKHYYVNIGIGLRGTQYITKIGNGWFESHALKPTIQTLRECINLMNHKRHNIETLLEFNAYKDKNRIALMSPLYNYECLPPYPSFIIKT